MSTPDLVPEEEYLAAEKEEQDELDQLRRFVRMAVDDPAEKKKIKVGYNGARFFGDFLIRPTTLEKALKND